MDNKNKYPYKYKISNLLERLNVNYPNLLSDEAFMKLSSILLEGDLEVNHNNFSESYNNGNMKDYVNNLGIETLEVNLIKETINLESVTDFISNEQAYIKIKLNDGTVKILENNTQYKAMDLFDYVKEEVSKSKNETDVLEIFKTLEKTFIDIPVDRTNNMSDAYMTDEQIKYKIFVESSFTDKTILASNEKNIFIVLGAEEDIIVKVETINGELSLVKIEEQKYINEQKTVEQQQNNNEHDLVNEGNEMLDYNMDEARINDEIENMIIERYDSQSIYKKLSDGKNYSDEELTKLFELIEEKCSVLEKDNGIQKKLVLPDTPEAA